MIHRNPASTNTHLAIAADLLAAPVATKGIDSSVRRILQHAQHASMCKMSPDQLASPGATIGSFGELQRLLAKCCTTP